MLLTPVPVLYPAGTQYLQKILNLFHFPLKLFKIVSLPVRTGEYFILLIAQIQLEVLEGGGLLMELTVSPCLQSLC